MDDPPFYRDDLQAYYDMRISAGDEQPTAMSKTKRHFKIRSLTVTPTGEVRSPGIVDNPDQPEVPAAGPPEGGEEPPEGPPEDPGGGSQMGDEDPAGKDKPPAPKSKDRNVPNEAIDEAWFAYLDTNRAIELFEPEVSEHFDADELSAWEAPDLEEHWRPAHLPQRNRSGPDADVSRENAQLYERFQRLVNMRAGELRAHLRSAALREAIATTRRSKRGPLVEGQKAARYVLRMKSLPLAEWNEDMWEHCRKVVTFIERTRRNNAPLLDEAGHASRKLITLRTWGHNPTVRATVSEEEIEPLLAYPRALHRYLDATPGLGPVAIVSEKAGAPPFDSLKKGKVKLTDKERGEVMKRKAVWHHGPGGSESSAVWKARVGNRTWFVTNTHRAYNARPSLDGAVTAYHRGIKQTA
jgi:hypothetical protein